ncbi:MAG TPA: hypothetical protein VM598_10825, partial [Bdellovibrionota bacterium]|nr:hypothetical protein [Bdellovibrionota bacterium]
GATFNGPVTQGMSGATLVDQILCGRADAQIVTAADREHPSKLQKYCRNLSKLTGTIRGAAARAGAAAGKGLRGIFDRD